ncbi:hypothetical protein GNI_010970 [Gregarina niphandrodes]|uniref:Uncharacterized protein n=1 Tax=Gregarina niphandrodes TaxID=110365 RepID=A0A023BCX0_GRENI|nr:hypothetical protein GNI_010970 [Gregarina niphandrodes]EZG86030.1 hypothetical protein GNI_010970 [Gregarina niphandrodes]|eukprot:XP_011128785.1 hypothetical protein GNI_010970 [Gregarina niphandrodes]
MRLLQLHLDPYLSFMPASTTVRGLAGMSPNRMSSESCLWVGNCSPTAETGICSSLHEEPMISNDSMSIIDAFIRHLHEPAPPVSPRAACPRVSSPKAPSPRAPSPTAGSPTAASLMTARLTAASPRTGRARHAVKIRNWSSLSPRARPRDLTKYDSNGSYSEKFTPRRSSWIHRARSTGSQSRRLSTSDEERHDREDERRCEPEPEPKSISRTSPICFVDSMIRTPPNQESRGEDSTWLNFCSILHVLPARLLFRALLENPGPGIWLCWGESRRLRTALESILHRSLGTHFGSYIDWTLIWRSPKGEVRARSVLVNGSVFKECYGKIGEIPISYKGLSHGHHKLSFTDDEASIHLRKIRDFKTFVNLLI